MKNTIIKPSILPGFMELLPNEQRIFNDIVNKITTVYEENGCLPIDTPIIEKSEVLLAKTAGETEKQVYSFTKGSKNLSLRFDLTVPFARYTAQYLNDLTFPFKRYQIGKVYRGERNQKGRYREFYQCDVDIIGKDKLSIKNDTLVISLASKAFKSFGLNNYKFQISNRKILSGLLESLNINNINEVMILIDKFDKIGKETFEEELKKIVDKENVLTISKIININGSKETVLLELESFNINNEEYGSICSGGRYDNLAENYTNNLLPGVGISIGLTRLFFVLKEIGFISKYQLPSKIDYLIIPIGDTFNYCYEVYNKLYSLGKTVEIYFEEDKLKKKINYANKLSIPYVILLGEEEENNSTLNIKDMKSGLQETVKFELIN